MCGRDAQWCGSHRALAAILQSPVPDDLHALSVLQLTNLAVVYMSNNLVAKWTEFDRFVRFSLPPVSNRNQKLSEESQRSLLSTLSEVKKEVQ